MTDPSSSRDSNIARLRRKQSSTRLWHRDFLVMQLLLAWMKEIAVKYCSGTILDFGCGSRPYYPIVRPHVHRYVSADVMQNSEGTVDVLIEPDSPLPFGNDTFDAVLSTQVLEHTRRPADYVGEAARVLRPGGHLILTCPASYMLHEEPHDYYRFTRYGVQHLLESHQFELIRIDPSGGAWRLMGQIFLNHKAYAKRIPLLSKLLYFPWVILINCVCLILDRINTNTKDTANYMVIARKH